MSSQFLTDFEESLKKLANVKENIQLGIKTREDFTNNLKKSLNQINERLKDLAGKISTLKSSVDSLQNQIQTNVSSVDSKENTIKELQQKITQLEQERQTIINQFNEQKTQLEKNVNERQQQIDSLETQLRDLTNQKDVLESEKNTLKTELQSKGDVQGQHVEQISMQSEESLQRLQQQQTDLTQKINDCESKINNLEQQLKTKDEELARINQENINQQNNTATTIQNLQQQIENLTKQNEDLTQRIIQATQVINEAADNFDIIFKSVPNAQTQEEVNSLVGDIERSIENISRALQGQNPNPNQSSQQNPTIGYNTPINIIGFSGNLSTTISKSELLKLLNDKDKELSKYGDVSSKKYKNAIEYINNLKSDNPEDITNYLKIKRIIVNPNKSILGGRKTKKIKKQKGGFVYNKNSKRKSIVSHTNTLRKKSNSTNSSRRSSY